jgi:isocitrate lyase
MPKLDISLDDEQKAFEADVAAIEKQWKSPRQAHLKRFVKPADIHTCAACTHHILAI